MSVMSADLNEISACVHVRRGQHRPRCPARLPCGLLQASVQQWRREEAYLSG
jgi:hypothetical protein